MNLASILAAFNLADQALAASEPAIEEYGSGDHVDAAQNLIKVAGATAMASTSDSTIQAEAQEATSLALAALPAITAFVGLFKKKAVAPTPLADLTPSAGDPATASASVSQ
jgi:hypothetical protein